MLSGSVFISLPRMCNTRGESQTPGSGDSYLSVSAAAATLISKGQCQAHYLCMPSVRGGKQGSVQELATVQWPVSEIYNKTKT